MADLPTNLETLQDNADDIALVVDSISTAIEGRGGTLPENAGLRDFPGAITNIPDRFTPTEAQLAAMNSGITAEKVEKTDRIIMDDTETQDYYMQDSTPSNPSEGDYWITDEPIVSSDVSAMTGYVKAQTASAIATTDPLNEAIGKIEKKADDNTTGLNSKQNEVLGSWTAGSATTHSTPASTDTVLEALQKIDNNQRNDESNVSSVKSKTDRIIMDPNENTILYVQATQPTGNISEGSIWINTAVVNP